MTDARRILLTGATGYIGGRLLPLLEREGHQVRCLARDPEPLRRRTPGTEVVQGDVLDRSSLDAAMAGVHTAYYLVHSMGATGRFDDLDRVAATTFAEAARDAGVARIIYLGGLGDSDSALSTHLRSRQEVGELLRRHAGTASQVVEFRASIVIGVGSVSFEMIRALVERLPVMITPRWVTVLAQPIAVDDVLAYLVAGAALPPGPHRTFEIGGRDALSYRDIMREYARQRGLRRIMIPVPVLTPRLSSLWLALVTPLYARVGRRLVDSLRHPTVVRDDAALRDFDIVPRGVTEAVAEAIASDDRDRRNRLVDARSVHVDAAPDVAFAAILRLGGANGWYYGNRLWQLRGALDRLVGGPGMSRGRRHPDTLTVGEPLDCWRVDACDPGHLLLRAEMKLPGRGWLEFKVSPEGGGSRISQTAVFDPRGLPGRVYWYILWPVHELVFAGMLRGIARSAEA